MSTVTHHETPGTMPNVSVGDQYRIVGVQCCGALLLARNIAPLLGKQLAEGFKLHSCVYCGGNEAVVVFEAAAT